MTNISLQARAYLPENSIPENSDIESLNYTHGGLVIVLACSQSEARHVTGIQLSFCSVSGFRLLDEAELARYWISNDFPRGSHLLEVIDGGWAAEESVLQGYERPRREWLVITGNACVSVLCAVEPEVAEVVWKYDDQ
ncbi:MULTISPECIES: hypothetical protein [unclassified Janthinobacterium]|uniref:hypothetical protein n=1 Tax=unclassified Janthinobacterium TaxID=2610881 RepID=UPI00160C26D7|nr:MULTISPECIES: hypothetical protein [unclassified Janthinobacterium]MBB5609536.1 hypothetical protein [Janthinobacterium sp. S3T4]MBB5614617.1 hypothetical protein [Janthinobacterium sp. S3M3]